MEKVKRDLTGKIVFVTGSAGGLGSSILLAFAKSGATVVGHYRSSKKKAGRILCKVREYSPDSFLVSGDLTEKEDVKSAFSFINKRVKSVDILINTIGNFIYKPLDKTSFDDMRDVWESNLYSVVLCLKAVLPTMRKKGYGHIINFGSAGCERILLRPKTTPYYMAKTGVYMLTKMFAYEEARYGIHINMISPGVLPTSVVKPKSFPTGCSAGFEDVIDAIFFLLSDNASYIIGANIEVSGGWSPEL